jgi:transposase
MPIGRPSKYSPAYCEEVVTFCDQGYSLTAFAGEIGVARSTINEWIAEFPAFSEAVGRAKSKRARWWEDRARGVASEGGQSGQATMVIFGLKNHAPEDFREKTEIVGADGKDLIPPEADHTKVALALLGILHGAKKPE